MSFPLMQLAARTRHVVTGVVSLVCVGCGGSDPQISTDPGTNPPPPVDTVVVVSPRGVVQVDTTQRFQTMTGWESTAQGGQLEPGYLTWKDTLLTLATADLGINRLRIELRSGSEHTRDYYLETQAGRLTGNAARCARYETVNDDNDPLHINPAGFKWTEFDGHLENLVIPFKQRMAALGKPVLLNVNYVGFITQCPTNARYDHAVAAEYAEFVRAAVLHMREKYGLVPDLWETILEPDNTLVWNGTYIGQAMVAAANLLKQDGITLKFVGPSNTNMGTAIRYYDDLIAVPGAKALLSEFSYHRYSGVSASNLADIGARSARDNMKTAMLEHIGSGVDDLYDDVLIGNNSAWSQFALAFPNPGTTSDDGGLYYLFDFSNPARPIPREAKRTRFLRQVFTAGPLNSVRIGAGTSNAELRPLAFRATNGKVGIAIRTMNAATFTVGGLPPGTYSVTYATDAIEHGRTNDVTSTRATLVTLTMPAAGVITLIGK
jgi:hypothetical protein